MGMKYSAYIREENDCARSTSHKCQRKELAEHTMVHRVGKLRQVSVALVLYTGRTRGIVGFHMVNVQRRQHQHRQEDCQQNPTGYMSFSFYVHTCNMRLLSSLAKIQKKFPEQLTLTPGINVI